MAYNSDTINFDIEGSRKAVSSMREANLALNQLQKEFLDYVTNSLENNWKTESGVATVDKLKTFATGDFQEYINYLSSKIDDYENGVIPALERINRA